MSNRKPVKPRFDQYGNSLPAHEPDEKEIAREAAKIRAKWPEWKQNPPPAPVETVTVASINIAYPSHRPNKLGHHE